jgi:hypothetical protein
MHAYFGQKRLHFRAYSFSLPLALRGTNVLALSGKGERPLWRTGHSGVLIFTFVKYIEAKDTVKL